MSEAGDIDPSWEFAAPAWHDFSQPDGALAACLDDGYFGAWRLGLTRRAFHRAFHPTTLRRSPLSPRRPHAHRKPWRL